MSDQSSEERVSAKIAADHAVQLLQNNAQMFRDTQRVLGQHNISLHEETLELLIKLLESLDPAAALQRLEQYADDRKMCQMSENMIQMLSQQNTTLFEMIKRLRAELQHDSAS